MISRTSQSRVTKKPRILHASHFRHVAPGVINQLSAEADAVKKLGIPWEVTLISDRKENIPFLHPIPSSFINNLLLSRLYFWISLLQRRNDFDFLLLRHVPADPFAPIFTPFFPNRASIHHTKELEELQISKLPFWQPLAVDREDLRPPYDSHRKSGHCGHRRDFTLRAWAHTETKAGLCFSKWDRC